MIGLVCFLSIFGDPGASAPQDPQPPSTDDIQAALQAKDYEALELAARRALLRDENNPLGWFYLGYSKAARGDFRFAQGAYLESLRHGLRDFQVYYQLGYCAWRDAKYGIAEEHLAKALEMRGEDANTLYYLGVSRYELKKDKGAEEALTALLTARSPWEELGHLYRGLARWRLGHRKEAREDLEWVMKHGTNQILKTQANGILLLEQQSAAQGPTQGPAAPLPVPPPATGKKSWSISLY